MVVRVVSLPEGPGAASRVVDIPMTAEERSRVHRRLRAPDGTELVLDLPTGMVLAPGQVVAVVGDTAYRVQAVAEEVLLIDPRDAGEGVRVGHVLGNLHRDLCLEGSTVVVLWDPVLFERLRRLGVRVERSRRAFTGRALHGHSP
jgi:urease accessory protein